MPSKSQYLLFDIQTVENLLLYLKEACKPREYVRMSVPLGVYVGKLSTLISVIFRCVRDFWVAPFVIDLPTVLQSIFPLFMSIPMIYETVLF